MLYTSTQRYIRVSPRKLRDVVFVARGLKPAKAVEILPHTGKKSAVVVVKALKTAVANATVKGANPDDLILKEIQVNEGPRLKRYRAGSRGAASPYQRRMSHIRIVLEAKPKPENLVSKPKTGIKATGKTKSESKDAK